MAQCPAGASGRGGGFFGISSSDGSRSTAARCSSLAGCAASPLLQLMLQPAHRLAIGVVAAVARAVELVRDGREARAVERARCGVREFQRRLSGTASEAAILGVVHHAGVEPVDRVAVEPAGRLLAAAARDDRAQQSAEPAAVGSRAALLGEVVRLLLVRPPAEEQATEEVKRHGDQREEREADAVDQPARPLAGLLLLERLLRRADVLGRRSGGTPGRSRRAAC